MKKNLFICNSTHSFRLCTFTGLFLLFAHFAFTQVATKEKIEDIAIIEQKVMVPSHIQLPIVK